MRRLASWTVFTLLLATRQTWAQDKKVELKFDTLEASKAEYDRTVAPFLKSHCVTCHGPKREEGELSFDKLETDLKSGTSAGRWAMVVEKLVTREMPPEGRPRPSDESVKAVVAWIKAEFKRAGKNFARREAISNGNTVPHDKLFDPKFTAAFDSPVRLRRLSPEIYAAFLADVAKNVPGVSQPFTPETKGVFKDMGTPKLDEPTTIQLIRNAVQIVERQTAHKIEDGKVKGIGFVNKDFVRLFDESKPLGDADIEAAYRLQFRAVLARQPTKEELARFTALMHKNVKDAGRVAGVRYALAAVFLLPEALFRWELGVELPADKGRVRLAPREIAFALAYALTDKKPDASLLAAAEQGKLDTKEGVAAEVRRLLDDPKLEKPRILRFFREYFGYDKALEVFQDQKANPDHDPRVLVEDTDKLVLYILERDRNVLHELLTTNKSFVAYKTAKDTKMKRLKELAKFEENKKKDPAKFKNKTPPKSGKSIYLAYNLTDFPDEQPVDLPANERAGILTQPSWLAGMAKTDENHAIFRGKWVRERLLGGVVPDVPITVDAQLPVAPDKTLRERMTVTEQAYCWKCHQFMNPVGLPFEMYDHFGRFRTEELGKPVNASGAISGDPVASGTVKNAVEMLHKLAGSERVAQVFVRHAFRYWMGRNETLGDGPSLQQAHKAYKDSGGSMKSLIVALLTSDSFLYRAARNKD